MKSKGWVEIEAPTVDESLILGLTQLGIARDEADITVLDEGSTGFLGIGAREARVRVERKVASAPAEELVNEEPIIVQKEAVPLEQPPVAKKPDVRKKVEEYQEKPAESTAALLPAKSLKAPSPRAQESQVEVQEPQPEMEVTEEQAGINVTVLEIAENLFGALEIELEVIWRVGDGKDRPELWLSLQGEDAALLAEPEVLNAAQFLTRILVRSKNDGNFNLILDAGGHRWHHTHKLQQLALQTAEKATRLDRPVRLQPMTSRERRYVHMVLRHDSRVRTQSYGSGKGRAVTVFPTKE
ncbi:MAG TPA: hypothetical protein G4N98_02030 [Thermoflexia bacterium]|nr:hypothetical protein [Thermoflexia bacterium]